jgi:hypothetical protein
MNPNTVTIGECRLSYVHVFEPFSNMPGQDPKFSLVALLPKTNTAGKAAIDVAIDAARQIGMESRWGGQAPAMLATTIHDGDGLKQNGEAYGEECKGHWVINCNANTDHPPKVLDRTRQPMLDQTDMYSGCYGYVNVTFYPYLFSGKKGIGCGLNMLMKTRDGQPLGGSAPSVDEAFAGVAIPEAAPQINPITGLPY